MLLMTWDKTTNQVYLAQQKSDFQFNRLDEDGGTHRFGKKWLYQSRYLIGPKEWTQIGPLNMVEWGE